MKDINEMIAIMQAYADGMEIEIRSYDHNGAWEDTRNPSWNWAITDYRVKSIVFTERILQGKTRSDRTTIELSWNGKTDENSNIEYEITPGTWITLHNPGWMWERYDYRVKSEILQGKTIAERNAIEEAFKEFKNIEYFDGGKWQDATNPNWEWAGTDYRIKPELIYIPYTVETWKQDIDKFRNEFVVNKDIGTYESIIAIHPTNSLIATKFNQWSFDLLFERFIWEDGTPCGTIQ